MIRKQLAVILACAMVFCMMTSFSSIAMAAGETLISDRAGLEHITGDGSYRLTADIDLAGADWTPLAAFSGTLDGGGHVIRNLSITDTTDATGNDAGLFATITTGGKVVNLGIESANITAGNNTGGIAGTNYGAISCCYTTGTVSGGEHVGGLVGKNFGTIVNCYSRAAVSSKEYWGGLAGSNSGTIETSYAASNVSDSVMNNFLEFKSINDPEGGGYIDIPHKDAYRVDAFTLEAWFQWDKSNIEADNVEFIVGKDFEHFEIHTEGGSGPNGIRFIPIPNPKVDGYGASSGYGGYEKDSWIDVHNVLQPGWFHVAAVYSYNASTATNNVEIKVYVNGEAQELFQVPEDGSAARSVGTTAKLSRNSNPLKAITNDAGLGIGWRRESNGYFFNGKIADVRLWNTARTEEEIRANKDRVLTGSETGLVGYWKLNEASGITAIDSSSTQNNGTLTNVRNGSVTRMTLPASTNKGALTASNTGLLTNCFYDSTLYGPADGGAGTAKSTGEMKTQGTFSVWDFNRIWSINTSNNDGYPSFRAKAVTVIGGTADKSTAVAGDTVTITAGTPTTGKRFKEWTGTDGLTFTDSTGITSSVAKFTMPSNAVTVTATYENIPSTQPTINKQPANQSVKAGETATFTVEATGYPAPTYQWQINKNDGKGWIDISGATSASYTIGATTLSDNGKMYRCEVVNSVGSATSAEVMLTVKEDIPATITTQPISQSVKAGETATFTVAATREPTPTYQWQINRNDGKDWVAISGATSASYTTVATTLSDSGNKYRCYIVNSVGSATSVEVTLTVTNESVPQSSHSHYTEPTYETVYNAPNIPQATIWLTGNDFADNDRLVTETLTSGESYNAMLRLAECGKVFKAYNISLQSGMKPSGNDMHITFDLAQRYAGKTFTLVHAKDDGTYEYFHATADANGDLSFGPLYTLSPFMLVEGALTQASMYEVDVPKTGDSLLPVLCTAFMLMAGAVLTAGFAKTKKRSSR